MLFPALIWPSLHRERQRWKPALLGVPMIIIYKIFAFLGTDYRQIDHYTASNIGLVNIIAGKTIAPELLQQ
ncbi:MAG: hypothetical protein MZV70_09705 [Desulfobacterales bacterium]|nr:hypothetical protein [Desulfobacterales bacterium]